MTSEQLLILISDTTEPIKKMEVVRELTSNRLKALLNVDEIPTKFEYIIDEVTLKRFNRLGLEGVQSYSQEGLSETFQDSDFKEFEDEIKEFRENNDDAYLDYWVVYKA